MGLDQYLFAEIRLHDYDKLRPEARTDQRQVQGQLRTRIVTDLGLDGLLATNNGLAGVFTFPPLISVRLQVAYWRKCNQIHRFFEATMGEPFTNGDEIPVDRDDLLDLQGRIACVKADHSQAEELLPTQNGFFFGSTDYDEGYFEDLDETEAVLKRLLTHKDEDIRYIYSANW